MIVYSNHLNIIIYLLIINFTPFCGEGINLDYLPQEVSLLQSGDGQKYRQTCICNIITRSSLEIIKLLLNIF